MIRNATENDINEISTLYELIHDEEESGRCTIGWVRGVYPTIDTAREGIASGDMFVMEENGRIFAAMRINNEQVPEYANVAWEYDALDSEICVMHTLVVDPSIKRQGIGRRMVCFYEEYAVEKGCHFLRIDTNEKNERARAMYEKLGYKEVGITPCRFNGIEGVQLVCIEKCLKYEEDL